MIAKLMIKALLMTALALALIVALFWFAFMIADVQHARITARSQKSAESIRAAAALRLKSLYASSEADRTALDTLLRVDAITAADTLTAAGNRAGVTLHIQAAGESQAGDAAAVLNSAAFDILGEGSYGALLRVVSQLENIPMPMRVSDLELSHSAPEKGTPMWTLRARVVFTTSVPRSL